MAAFVAALGGQSVPYPQDATHALYVPSSSSSSTATTTNNIPPSAPNQSFVEAMVIECQTLSVPIVDATWLERMSGLRRGEHWSDVDVGSYVPAIVALIDTGEAAAGASGSVRNDTGDDIDMMTMDDIGVGGSIAEEVVGFDGHASAPISIDGSASSGTGRGGGRRRGSGSGSGFRSSMKDIKSGLKQSLRRGKRDRLPPVSGSNTSSGSMAGRDAQSRLSRSISQTFAYLSREHPDLVEEDAIRRAMELSMLDCALVLHSGDTGKQHGRRANEATAAVAAATGPVDPHDVLGVPHDATPEQIKAAYRKLALTTHPDKGGSADEFFRIARAYRALLNPTHDDGHVAHPPGGPANLKSTAHWDAELQDHRRLVEDLFASHGANLEENAARLQGALDELGLVARDAGSVNRNERDELIANSCFYLSLASSYLRGIGALTCPEDGLNEDDVDDDVAETLREADGALTGETALQLKRLIEAAVVKAHPEWAARGLVGEEVQAFSDFLVYTLDSSTMLSDWAVVVFDTTSGFVDIYKGKAYGGIADKDRNWASTNTITLRYVPGHYQPLIPLGGGTRPALKDVLACLDKTGVFYVVTDGSA